MVDRFLRDIQDAFLGNRDEESDRDRDNDRRVRPASEDPYGDPADYGYGPFGDVRPASEDPYGDPADEDQYGYISPASEDPYGDPADEEYYRY